MTTIMRESPLTEPMIERFGGRAGTYDRDNRFFSEDFEELREAGYLKMAIPEELGGAGMTLPEVCTQQRALAYRAPATALATNMHLYWTGVAADLRRMGDASLEWILKEAADGEVFAAGHGEAGNDVPLLLSTSRAERTDGGYRFYGHKIFGSLSPVWTRLGVHAMDATDPAGPQIIHAFMPRDTQGYSIKETWDTLGMRATRSDDTIIDGAFIPDRYIARKLPAGQPDIYIVAIFAWAEMTFGSIYLGMADRARALAIETAKKRTSLGLSGAMSQNPEVQHAVADMVMAMEPASAYVARTADEWVQGVTDPLVTITNLVAAKDVAVEAAKKVVDLALAISGGSGMFRSNELERMYRDVRCGGFHPANTLLAHEIVGKSALGIHLNDQPRWG
jgi:alkylation response protein AidB-like acyl-CoA dehydrogenase